MTCKRAMKTALKVILYAEKCSPWYTLYFLFTPNKTVCLQQCSFDEKNVLELLIWLIHCYKQAIYPC